MTLATFAMNATDKTGAIEWQAGYRFEFYCELCKTAWQPGYQVDGVQEAASWARLAAINSDSTFSSVAANAMLTVSISGAAERREQAFQSALAQCERHFRECPSCLSIVCASCFIAPGMCRWCVDHGRAVPRTGQEAQPLYRVGPQQPQPYPQPVQSLEHPPCRRCRAPYGGTRFCGHCGLEHILR
ncbi:MAG TPA: hypothetical protein PLA44_06760 [Propionibacteriaceae bacterium]|nr:hypothetical protein [Propionibacteriaceae bacterium]